MSKPLFIYTAILFVFINSCSKDSEPKEIPDTIAPTVEMSIQGMSNIPVGEVPVVSNQVVIGVDAKDAGGISKIEAFINDEKVGEDTSTPYSIVIDVSSYTSKKAGKTQKYEDYTLKVTATDKVGNASSTEQKIHIDNEIPSITEVSMEEGTVISGDTNVITFAVSDNEEIFSVMIYVNDELFLDVNDEVYEVNIDTSVMSDGENTIRIEVKDKAENLGSHTVNFIVDNTGPEINIESIVEGQILDELISLEPQVSDQYSEVVSFEVLYENTSLIAFDNTATNYQFNFDPENHPVGDGTFVLVAKDSFGNETINEISIEIFRRLITINFPANYYNPLLGRVYVFASSIDGKVLDTKRVFQDTEKIVLRTKNDIDLDTEFMLTFGEYQTGSIGNNSELTTLKNLKRTTPETINLKTYPRFDASQTNPSEFPTEGFDPDDQISVNAEGFGYGGSYYPDTKELVVDRRRNMTSNINTDFIYIPLESLTLNQYSYLKTDWEIPSDFVLTPDLFSNEGVELKFFEPIIGNGSYESSNIWIAGYFNDNEFQNNIYHRIYGKGHQGAIPSLGISYYFNTMFDKYRYNVRLNDYYTERTGEPLSVFQTLDWSIDYSFSNNEIDIIKSGVGHTVGKIYIGSDAPLNIGGLDVSYRWSFVFDSEKTDKVIVPEIPEEMQSWGFYSIYEQQNLEVRQVEIRRYAGIASYNEYIEEIIKNNRFSYTVSPVMESKFKSVNPTYYHKPPHFLLD